MNLPPGRSGPRRLHLRLSTLAMVWVGGALGTGARFQAGAALPAFAGIDVATFVVNVLGAFALGVLLERLAHPGPDDGWRTVVRLAAGSGFLGGLTTYSALALDAVDVASAGRPWTAVVYGIGTLLFGALAAWSGMWAGSRTPRLRSLTRGRGTR